MKVLVVFLIVFLSGCDFAGCPLEPGDRVKHVIHGKVGTIKDTHGAGAADCSVLVLFDDKTWSYHQQPINIRIDNRYADNWDFELIQEYSEIVDWQDMPE